MKSVIFLLGILAFASCEAIDIKDAVCGIWSGWGQGMKNEACANTIAYTCDKMFTVIEDIKDLIKNFDIGKIIKIGSDIYQTIHSFIKQFKDCEYIQNFTKFIKNFINFIKNIDKNLQHILRNINGFIRCYSEGRYYDAGIFLGNIFRIIIGE